MKKIELILSSVLISLALSGCDKTNDVANVGTPNDGVKEIEEIVNEGAEVEENKITNEEACTIKLEFLKELEYSEIITLSENRIFVVNDENSVIYDENLNVVKEVGNAILDRSDVNQSDRLFIYKVPYFHDGKMQYKEGLMDFDGNILYEAKLLDSSEKKEMNAFIQSNRESNDYEFGFRLNENGTFEIARIQRDLTSTGSDVSVLEVLLEWDCDVLLYDSPWWTLKGDYNIPENEETYHDVNSVAFKKDDQWGVVGFDGNIILQPEYGEVVFSHHSSIDGLDYYIVTNELGKVGIFNTNGWVIEPTFSYEDDIFMLGVNTVVAVYNTQSGRGYSRANVYNKEGNLIKEFSLIESIKPIVNFWDGNKNSEVFFQVKDMGSSSSNYTLYDSNFNEVKLSKEISKGSYYFYFLNDELLLLRNDASYDLINTKGNLIAHLPYEFYWINDKYVIYKGEVYEITSK